MNRIIAAVALCAALLFAGAAQAQVTAPRYCSKSQFANITSVTTTQIVPNVNQAPYASTPTVGGVAPQTTIYICGYVLIVGTGDTAVFQVGAPTSLPGTGCGASPTALSVTYPPGQYLDMASVARGFEVPAGNVLCVTTTGASSSNPVNVQVYYDNNPL